MIIYKIINKINNKAYIGQTINSLDSRLATHRCKPSLLNRAIKKYGWDNFETLIIDTATTKEELNDKEKSAILSNNTLHPNGYNILAGGKRYSGDYKHSEEAKQKISRASRKNMNNPDIKSRFSERMQGSKNPFWGKTHDEDTKYKIIQANLGRHLTDETKNKIRQGNLGKTVSEETRQLIANAQPNIVKIRCIETGQIFDSINEAGRILGLNPSNINSVLHGRRKSTGRLHFERISDDR